MKTCPACNEKLDPAAPMYSYKGQDVCGACFVFCQNNEAEAEDAGDVEVQKMINDGDATLRILMLEADVAALEALNARLRVDKAQLERQVAALSPVPNTAAAMVAAFRKRLGFQENVNTDFREGC